MHPVGVVEILAESDAEEDVVRVVVVASEEVRVVGRQHREVQLFGELEDAAVEGVLVLGGMRLDLEVVPVAKDISVP